MFTIIGGDGREYGPATADQLRGWINAGRANLDTKAKVLGSEEWRRLGDFAEFATPSSPPALGSVVVPPIPMAAPMPAATTIPVVVDANLADRGARLLAALLDNVLVFVAGLPGGVLIFTAMVRAAVAGGDIEDISSAMPVAGVLLLLLGLVVVLAIQIWMLTTRGQTVGKRLMSVRIVLLANNANPGFVGAVLMRAVIPACIGAVPVLGAVFSLVDICFIFRDDRRCLHDLIAGTKVVKA